MKIEKCLLCSNTLKEYKEEYYYSVPSELLMDQKDKLFRLSPDKVIKVYTDGSLNSLSTRSSLICTSCGFIHSFAGL